MTGPRLCPTTAVAATAAILGLLALPSAAAAANRVFSVPVQADAPSFGGAMALHQTLRPMFLAHLAGPAAAPDNVTVPPEEFLVGGTVGQGLMYCAGPRNPKVQMIGQNRPDFMAVCFRDTAGSGVFDQVASQIQTPTRANSIMDAGFSQNMHWMPIQAPYRKVALEAAPLITVDISARPAPRLLLTQITNHDRITVSYTLCIPRELNHSVTAFAGKACGQVQFSRRFANDPNGYTLANKPGGPPARFASGPMQIDFSTTADGAITSTVVQPFPTGEARLSIYGELRSRYVTEALIYLVEPVGTAPLQQTPTALPPLNGSPGE